MSPLSVNIFSTIVSTCVMLVGPMMSGFTRAVVTGMHSTRVMRMDLIDFSFCSVCSVPQIIYNLFYKVNYNGEQMRNHRDGEALPDYEVVKYRMAGMFLTTAD